MYPARSHAAARQSICQPPLYAATEQLAVGRPAARAASARWPALPADSDSPGGALFLDAAAAAAAATAAAAAPPQPLGHGLRLLSALAAVLAPPPLLAYDASRPSLPRGHDPAQPLLPPLQQGLAPSLALRPAAGPLLPGIASTGVSGGWLNAFRQPASAAAAAGHIAACW